MAVIARPTWRCSRCSACPTIIASYDEAWPLADGWQERVGIHQLHPLLVHAAMFGGGYGARAAAIATHILRS
jgi:fructosamine-3-kinase